MMAAQTLENLNFQPLTTPITPEERKAVNGNGGLLSEIFLGIILLFMGVPAFLTIFHGGIASILYGTFWLAIVVITGWSFPKWLSKQLDTFIHAQRFAAANGFTLVRQRRSGGSEPGSIFKWGETPSDSLVMSGEFEGRPFEFGTHSYVTGSGKERQIHYVVFLRITLPRTLPNVMIDSRKNVIDLHSGVQSSQKLSLEGDFDKYFSVYVPAGYGADALYFLTPELMQLMVDHDQLFDMEVVDNQLYFYRNGALRYDEPNLRSLFDVMHHTGGEFAENTRLYHDDHAAATGSSTVIAPAGQHLKRHWRPTTTVGLILTVAYLAIMLFIVLRGIFGR